MSISDEQVANFCERLHICGWIDTYETTVPGLVTGLCFTAKGRAKMDALTKLLMGRETDVKNSRLPIDLVASLFQLCGELLPLSEPDIDALNLLVQSWLARTGMPGHN